MPTKDIIPLNYISKTIMPIVFKLTFHYRVAIVHVIENQISFLP